MPQPKKGPRLGSNPAHQRLLLSGLAAQLFVNEGINSVGDLVGKTESELMDIRNFGQKSIDEVKAKLEELGLSLRED